MLPPHRSSTAAPEAEPAAPEVQPGLWPTRQR